MSPADIIIIVLLAVAVAAIVVFLVKRRKKGGGCASCPYSNTCPSRTACSCPPKPKDADKDIQN